MMVISQLEYQLDNSILTQRTIRFRVGAEDVSTCSDAEAFKLRRKVDVPGFRRGNSPLHRLRSHHWPQIRARAFEEIKRAALEQVLRLLGPEDQPFLPPELVDPTSIELRYDQPLEFALKYMTDPTKISANPQTPQAQQGAVIPGHQIGHPAASASQGIPSGPQLPHVAVPGMSGPTMPTGSTS